MGRAPSWTLQAGWSVMGTALRASPQPCVWKALANLALCQATEGHIFFLWIEWTTLSSTAPLPPAADPPMEGSRNSWVELNGIYSCIGYGHGPGILHPRHTQPPAHMSSGIDCGWSSPRTVDRMWMINFSIKTFLKNMEGLFGFCSGPGFPDTHVILTCPWQRGELHN